MGVVEISDHIFEVVMAYTPILKLLVKSIPLGLNKADDKIFVKDIREDLLECTLILFRKVNEHLNFSYTSTDSDWEVMHN